MAASGILWVDQVFNVAVRWLYVWAQFFGISYEEINVWIFCVIWPLFTLFLLSWITILIRANRKMRSEFPL
jgi:hypothetical protein